MAAKYRQQLLGVPPACVPARPLEQLQEEGFRAA